MLQILRRATPSVTMGLNWSSGNALDCRPPGYAIAPRSARGPFSGEGLSIQLFQEVPGRFNHTRDRIAFNLAFHFKSASDTHSITTMTWCHVNYIWQRIYWTTAINLLASRRRCCNLKFLISKSAANIHNILSISREIAFRWMSHVLTDDKSTLVPVMAWCRLPLPEPMLTKFNGAKLHY